MSNELIQSFEVTNGGVSGDLLSKKREATKIKVGLIAGGYFEYWRMYDGLKESVEKAMQYVADNISHHCELIYPGLLDTLDKSDEAGRLFKKEHVDMIIIAQGTYCVDYLIHQALLHLPDNMPLILFASQAHSKLDFNVRGYKSSLENSGPMGIVQFACGLHKTKKYMNYEVVVGAIDDPEVYDEIKTHITIRQSILDLRHWTIGIVGHIFRGMYDFQYDKTDVTGKFGPHIMDIDIKHLSLILDEIKLDDPRVVAGVQKAHKEYAVSLLTDDSLAKGIRLGLAFEELVKRYKLDGLALLGQHFIEVQAETTCYLGLAQLLSKDVALAVTEGDVLGLIISKVIKDLTGSNPFFGEWEEVDTELNAIEILGHGFIDPRTARKDRPIKLSKSCEEWGSGENSPGFEATLEPGPATITHIINHGENWKIIISEGIIPDVPALQIDECTVIMQVETPIKEYYKKVINLGFSHHAIVASGHIGKKLECFAKQIGMQVFNV